MKKGFTLIELILVIGILAIIAVIAIGKFTDMRKESARRTNVFNLKNITHTLNVEIARIDGDLYRGMFAYAEALIDVDGKAEPKGAAGSYVWQEAWYNGAGGVVPGIYCGIKTSEVVANAAGVTTGEIEALASAHEKNVGLEEFAPKLGMYYLKDSDVTALKDAGLSIVGYHNYSNAQSSQLGWASSIYATQLGVHSMGGGPGMRPDLSACYPVILTNGCAVAVLNPAKCESIYRDLGLDFAATNNVSGLSASQPETYYTKGICVKLYAFGLGRDCAATTKFFENAPRCPTLDKTHYRNYILLFSQNTGKGNSGSGVKFAGVVDPQGNTVKQAQYNSDWAN